ncbi:MAG TPA: TIGR01777 family oxidoreductase [Terriglobales bacterium]|nr:TIGR01777 family oxidoreductase [Terriglobales bacterium]
MRILVSGASGTIGAALLPRLKAEGHELVRLVRGAVGPDQIAWDPERPLRPQSVSGFDAVVHLAGEPIVGRWTEPKKRRILESRVEGTRHLAEALAEAATPPQVFVSASAIGYYGDRGGEILLEESSSGAGFLAEVCRSWEAATQPAADAGIRVAQIRTGLVLSGEGGALQKMLTPFRMGVGGNVGSGQQWWSWIHVADLVGAVHYVLENDSLRGPINGVAPNSATNAEFTKTLAAVLHRPAIFPMPVFAVKLMFGQMGEELLLASQRVEPAKLVACGYRFQHAQLREALEDTLRS